MIDVKAAYSIVKQNNPNMQALSCSELKNEYVFGLIPDGLKPDDGYVDSIVHFVEKKTGKYYWRHFSVMVEKQVVRKIDVSMLD